MTGPDAPPEGAAGLLEPLRRHPLAWAGLLAAFVALASVGMGWGLPYDASWSNDDIAPTGPLKAYRQYVSDTSKYPYLQPLVDRALYEPTLRRARADGSLDPDCAPLRGDCFTDPLATLGRLQWISRARSLVMAAIAVVATGLLAGSLFGPQAALAAGLLAAVNETLGFYAKLGNLDAPYTMWFMLSMLAYVAVLRRGRRRAWATFGLLSGLTLATKEGVVGAYVLAGLVMLAAEVRRVRSAPDQAGATRAAALNLALMALGLFGVYLTVQNAFLNPAGFMSHLRHWVGGPGVEDFNDNYEGPIWLLGQLRERAVEGAGWPLLLLLLAGSANALRPPLRRQGLWLLLPVLSLLLFTILPIRFVYTRFLLPPYLLMAAASAPLALTLWRGRWPGRLLLSAALAYSGLYSLNMGLAMRADTRLAAEAWLAANLPPQAGVVAFGEESYFPRLEILPGDLETEVIDWQELPPYSDADPAADEDDERSAWQVALTEMLRRAEEPDLAAPPEAPDWLLLSSRGAPPARTSGALLWERLKAGEAGYAVAWDSDAAFPGMARDDGRPSPLGGWLPGATVEVRISPRIWVLRRASESGGLGD